MAVVVFPFVPDTVHPSRQAGGERVDGARIELPEQLARQVRAATAAGRARQSADGSRGHGLERKAGTHPGERIEALTTAS